MARGFGVYSPAKFYCFSVIITFLTKFVFLEQFISFISYAMMLTHKIIQTEENGYA